MIDKARLALLLAFLVALSTPAAAAPPLPSGPEIQVSTDAGAHSDPSVAVFPDGGFVVVWSSLGEGVRARSFDREGAATSDELDLTLGGIPRQVLASRNGSFDVVWDGVPPEGGSWNVYVSRFARDGSLRRTIVANAPSPSDRGDAVAALGAGGRLAVSWRARVDVTEDLAYTNAVARLFDARGKPLTPEVTLREGIEASEAGDDRVDAYPTGLALQPNGTLAAMVEESGPGLFHTLVVLRRGGSPVPWGVGFCVEPAALALARNGTLVGACDSGGGIVGQTFAPDGRARGPVFRVSAEGGDAFAADPVIAAQGNGTFVVVWTRGHLSGSGGDPGDVLGRAFAPNGKPRSQIFRINATKPGEQHQPAAATARKGSAVVVWSQRLTESGPSEIFARILSPS